jgi:adenine-specific DNA-methyltransferase
MGKRKKAGEKRRKGMGKRKEPGRMEGKSLSPQKELAETLKAQFPEVFSEGKVNPEKLKRALGEELDTNNERYGLSWAGKTDCYRHIQETTSATLKPIRGESVDFDKTENIFIEGDNLEVLKVLQRSYYGKIKMIYIDPPYNTGSDSFIYPDRFKEEKEDYEIRAGIKDAEGLLTKDGFWRKNSRDAGHFHSNWLSMMYPRLFLAKNLLSEDGVIFVSIDDNEAHNLRMIMDEIFGEENFLAGIAWKKRSSPDARATIGSVHDWILCYVRQGEQPKDAVGKMPLREKRRGEFANPDNDPRGPWASVDMTGMIGRATKDQFFKIALPSGRVIGPPEGRSWGLAQATFKKLRKDNRIWFGATGDSTPRIKNFLSESQGQVVPSFWDIDEVGSNDEASKEVAILLGAPKIFDTPKPHRLVKRMLQISNNKGAGEIVLDFFAGACTTAHAVMALNVEDGGNRKFICVQLAEPCEEDSEAAKAGFKTIADIGKERIRRTARKIKKETQGKLDFGGNGLDLGFKVFKLDESNFKQWREDIKTAAEFKAHLYEMVDNVAKGAKAEDMLYEIILKNSRFDLNAKVEKATFDGVDYYRLATPDKDIRGQAPDSEGTERDFEIVCLAPKITKKFVDKVLAEKPEKLTCLDAAFKNNDQLKTNTALQMEGAKIEFKVI